MAAALAPCQQQLRRIRGASCRARRGNVLVIFAAISLVLCGLAALVIDLGIARLTQARLQAAADVAALEGLRLRDDPNQPNPADRRQRASEWALQSLGDSGGGPVMEFGQAASSEEQQWADLRIGSYRPVRADGEIGLEYNLPPEGASEGDEDIAGDMVASRTGFEPDGNGDYLRPNPNGAVPALADSFLVRVRRSGGESLAGVSTDGPRPPGLFGFGTIPAEDRSGWSWPKGVAARGIAVAKARMARTVGVPSNTHRGFTPFYLTSAAEAGLTSPTSSLAVTLQSAGELTTGPDEVRHVFLAPATETDPWRPVSVGQQLSPIASLAALWPWLPAVGSERDGYVSIVDGTLQVQGFRWLRVIRTAADAVTIQPVVRITAEGPVNARLAPDNATAVYRGADAHTQAYVPTIALTDSLLAPVLTTPLPTGP